MTKKVLFIALFITGTISLSMLIFRMFGEILYLLLVAFEDYAGHRGAVNSIPWWMFLPSIFVFFERNKDVRRFINRMSEIILGVEVYES